jgi:Gram-negative bacterial TonB protein C-terminal
MKKLFALILIIFLNSIFALSQTFTPKMADWETFAPIGEEFSIETPIALSPQSLSTDNLTRRFGNSFDGTYFFIFSDNPKNPFQYNRAMDFVKVFRRIGTIEKIGEFETEKFRFKDNEDFYHTVLTAKNKNRIYVFQTISPLQKDSSVESFFGSLKLDRKLEGENKDTELQFQEGRGSSGKRNISEKMPLTVPVPNNQTTSPTIDKQTTPLRILSKPRANYTDFARFYEISGKIILRLTFLADGTIGAVSPVSKLPFGLTEQAIIAARGIRFEPAMKEGKPVTMTKSIEYSFTIY